MDLGLYESLHRVEGEHWWFCGRRAIVFDELHRAFRDRSRPLQVLDLGCGTGRNLLDLDEFGVAVGLDLESRALEYCQQRGRKTLVQGSAESLPFGPETFDLVMALDLLEHLDDDRLGALEILRILKPGGLLLAFVPAYQWLWGPQDDLSHHRRRYTASSLTRVLDSAGFEIVRRTHANLFLLPLILAGRLWLRGTRKRVDTENTLHPAWSNEPLKWIFSSERHLLEKTDLPLGVSILCVAKKRD